MPAVVVRRAGATLANYPRCGGKWQVFASVCESLTGGSTALKLGRGAQSRSAAVDRRTSSKQGQMGDRWDELAAVVRNVRAVAVPALAPGLDALPRGRSWPSTPGPAEATPHS